MLDPACGTGGFLVIAMNEVIRRLKASAGGDVLTEGYKQALNDQVQLYASQCFFGFDINPDLVKATKMNMVMNNDGSGNILRTDSLLHPHQWDNQFRVQFAKALDVDTSSLRSPNDLSHFDVIATNPPFGSNLPISDRETLSQFDLGHVWKKADSEKWERTEDIQASQPPEILFIERCWQFLKPGGRMAIVLPDGILGNPALEYVRFWIMTHCRVVASVDLHPDTFQPRNGTQTSILVLQRKTDDEMRKEERQRHLDDYEIFMAQTLAIGHDKRGNVLHERNEDGEEILYPAEGEETGLFEFGVHDEITKRLLAPVKRVDDDTPTVADEFLSWKRTAVLGW